jgi:nicotinic acid phosphoribosyltransferase
MAGKGLFSSIGRAAVIATVAAVTLTAVEPAVAETGPAGKGLSAAPAPRDATDFSARRRHYRGDRGAGAAAFAAVVGTGLAVAASQNRGAYDGDWGCSPVYCGPYYYRGDRYYGGYGYGAPIFPGW